MNVKPKNMRVIDGLTAKMHLVDIRARVATDSLVTVFTIVK